MRLSLRLAGIRLRVVCVECDVIDPPGKGASDDDKISYLMCAVYMYTKENPTIKFYGGIEEFPITSMQQPLSS